MKAFVIPKAASRGSIGTKKTWPPTSTTRWTTLLLWKPIKSGLKRKGKRDTLTQRLRHMLQQENVSLHFIQ